MMRFLAFGSLLLAFSHMGWAAVPAGCPAVSTDSAMDPAQVVKHSRYLPVPAKAIALLVGDISSVIALEGRYVSDPTVLGLSRDAASYRYLLLSNPGLHTGEFQYVPVGSIPLGQPGAKEEKYFDVTLANREMAAAWNIKSKYALVEVEVNEGQGSPRNTDRLVASKLTQVDGTSDYPIDVTATIERLSDCGASYFAQHQSEIDGVMKTAQIATLGNRLPTGPEENQRLMVPTWLSQGNTLEVRLTYQKTNGDYAYGMGIAPPPGIHFQGGARYGAQYGARTALVYQVDRNGRLIAAHASSIQPFHHYIPPPPAARPVRPH